MALRNPGGGPRIGKRWPYKALDFLPEAGLWKYLARKSGSARAEEPFHLGEALTACERILVVLPDGFQENLVAFPLVQSLVQARPGCAFLFLIDQSLTGFLAALLGSGRVVGLRRGELYWGESHFLELQRVLGSFRPDVSLNLRESSPPLLHFLLRAAGARIRVQAGGEAPAGFANVVIRPSDPPNHLRRYLQVARLWDAGGRPIPVRWTRLAPGPENLKEARSRLSSLGLRPEAASLFLWQHGNSDRERQAFRQAASEGEAKAGSRSLLIVNGAGPLFPTPPPPPDLAGGHPAIPIESTGLFLGLCASVRRCLGVNGPLLHLASLADADVEAHFGESDRAWDTSALNGRMRVFYAEGDPARDAAAGQRPVPP